MNRVQITTSYDIDTLNDIGLNAHTIIEDLNKLSKKVRVLSLDDEGFAEVEFSSRNSLKEFIIRMEEENGGPAINESEIEEYLNEIL